MTRLRIACVAALTSLALGVATVPAAVASSGAAATPKASNVPALYTTQVSGMTKSGKQFKGTYAIQRFVAGSNKVYAVGTLTGTVKGRHVTRQNVMLPASLTGAGSGSSARAAQATSCPILHLVLGPINLNLLGLQVTTNQIVVDITAIPGPGNLLGNLLCGVTGLLNQGGALSTLSGDLQQLAAALNGIASLLGGL